MAGPMFVNKLISMATIYLQGFYIDVRLRPKVTLQTVDVAVLKKI